MAQEYLFLGGILAVVLVTSFLVIRHLHAKRNGKEHRKINIKRLLWWLVFLCYIFVVAGATLFSRGGNYGYDMITPLFYSYRNAWNNWSIVEWRNIILNICMFVPFGLLLPMGLKWFRKCYRTYVAGFLFSLFIELSQMIFKIGIFEPDDLLDNTLGAIIGFGLFLVLFKLYAKEKANLKKGATFASNIPLIIVVASFVAIYIAYSCKELGNNNNCYAMRYNTEKLYIHGVSFEDDTTGELPVYKTEILTEDEADRLANEICARLGQTVYVKTSSDYYYNEVEYICKDDKTGDSARINISYLGGGYDYWVMNYVDAVSYSEEEAREALEKCGYDIPKTAEFEELSDARLAFTVKPGDDDGILRDGTITVELTKDKKVREIHDDIVTLTPYKDYKIISEAEAYKRITEGKFKRYGNDYLDIEVLSYKIAYSIDTKGFYQPNYRFDVNINGKEAWIMIPAIEKAQ